MDNTSSYVKLHIDFLAKFIDLSSSEKSTLLALSYFLEDDNTIDFSKRKTDMILQILKLSSQTFRNSLVNLQKAGLINRISYGFYVVDPMYISKPEHDAH